MRTHQDLVGRRFWSWRVLRLVSMGSSGHNPIWECRCQCGKVKAVRGDTLKRGTSRSCGCHSWE